MDKITINGGTPLSGKIKISSAKNSVLPIIAASLLCDGEILVKDCPPLSDVDAMIKIVQSIGGKANYDGSNLYLNCRDVMPWQIEAELTGRIRSSFFILGPILGRFKRATVSYPGGCEIGLRPIDLHIAGFKKLGVKITEESGRVICDGTQMKASEIDLDFPSVGATENVMLSAVLLAGTTVIRNAAREPEITDVANFVNALGGKIHGAGTDTIVIEGVKKLHGAEFTPIPDRIVAGTILCGCAIAGGKIRLDNFRMKDNTSLMEKFARMGCDFSVDGYGLTFSANERLHAIAKIETQPFPGFPTDMQAQIVATLCRADGCSLMVENLFESRYRYTLQLAKMGAKITVKDRVAVIKGVKKLHGACVKAEDLRGGAALVLAGLGAEGETQVTGVHHIDRGYYQIEDQLLALGAQIKREKN